MRVTFDNFSGGINNFVDPQKLSPTQAVDVLDAEIVNGSVTSVSSPKDIPTPTTAEVVYNPDGNRSLTKFGEDFYWSDNVTGELSSSIGYMGVEPPERPPKFIKRNVGERLRGEMKWTCVFVTNQEFRSAPSGPQEEAFFTTIDCERQGDAPAITDFPHFDPENIHTAHYSPHRRYRPHKYCHPYPSPAYGYKAGSIVQYDGKLYKSTADTFSPPTNFDGATGTRYLTKSSRGYWRTPALPLPPPADSESPDSPWVDATGVTAPGSDSIVIELPVSADPNVKEVAILRTADPTSSTFYEVARVPNGTKYFTDETENSLLLSMGPAVRFFNYPPPIHENPEYGVGGKYLTTVNEMFYLAVGNRLYLSEQSNPHAWDPLKFITFGNEITAIVPTQAAVIVFTENLRFLVSGSAFEDLVKTQLPTLQGCPNWRTVATVGNHIAWQSNDGIAIFGKQPEIEGDQVQLVTADRFKFDKIANFAVSANEVYYLFFDDYALAIDSKHNLSITKRNLPKYIAATYDQNKDKLYFLSPLGVWQEDAIGEDARWVYTTPRLEPTAKENEGTRLPKKLRRMWIDADNDVDMTVFLDGEKRWTRTLKKRERRDLDTYFKSGLTGQDMQFEFSSTGTMRSFTVDFRIK